MLKHRTPSISVVVNNYNYARFLPAALDSALVQLAEGDELVIVDDGSTDGSAAVLADYGGRPGVRVIRQANKGQLKAVTNGLAAARGELMALLDSDDEYLPGYLERLRECAAGNPGADFFFARARPEGPDAEALSPVARSLARMHYDEGPLGVTRCAAVLFGEYLGSPTSGLALRAPLARELCRACKDMPDSVPMNPRWRRLLGMPPEVGHHNRLYADGVIVRLASALGARKYAVAAEGFSYRIHGGNAFAMLPRRARLYLRFQRVRQVATLVAAAAGVPRRPPIDELALEAEQRATPLYRRRRVVLATQYGLGALAARGPILTRLLRSPRIARALLRPRPAQPAPELEDRRDQ
ncbi:glycosyltransferase family A protein [Pseudohaliea sp.]|uniref:glycosyltransferase family 2 protein n=1 Tax=Pseudohaliea sp. TaxID=2740289 RepID=UPI0032EB9D6D